MTSAGTRSSTASSRVGTPRLPLVIYVIALGTFLMGTSEFVLAGMLPSLAEDLHVSTGRAGLAITAFAVGMIVGAPVMTLATLHMPRRTTLVLSLVAFAAGHVLAAAVPAFGLLIGARFLTGVATGAFWAVGSVLAAHSAGPASRSRALGLVLGAGMMSYVVGVPAGSLTSQLVGWEGTFWGLAVLSGVAAAVVARSVPRDPVREQAPSVRAELAALRSRRLWLALSTCALTTFGVLSTYSYIAPLLIERTGLPEAVVPFSLMGFGLGAVLGNVVAGRLGDHHPYRTSLIAAGATLTATLGLLLTSTYPVPTLLFFAALGVVGLSANPIYVSLANRFGGDAPTLSTAMPTSIFNVGTAIGTAVSGVALDSSLGPLGPPLVGVIGAALVLLPLSMLAREDRHSAPT